MKRTLLLITVSCFLATNAFAGYIDFRDETVFGAGRDQASFSTTVDGIEITVEALPTGATLWWDSTDGFGVQYAYEIDEIESPESLVLTFGGSAFLQEVFLTDLFNEGFLETGSYQLDGGAPVGFEALSTSTSPATNGELTVPVGSDANFITFSAPGIITVDGQQQQHEYSVAGVDATPNPEPGTLLLIGSGIAGMGTVAWRRNRRK